MEGNTGSNPSTQYIGTADNTDLVFKTNGVIRMRIGTDGGVKTDKIRPLPGDSVVHIGGLYFITLRANGKQKTKKIIIH